MQSNKKTLVVLPGWGGSKKTWNEFVVLSRNIFDTTVIELPCFGEEPCPSSIWGVEEYAAFVVDQIKDKKHMVLLGHSFGGQVATYIAANNMIQISALILSGAASIRQAETIKQNMLAHIGKFTKTLFYILGMGRLFTLLRPILYKAIGHHDYAEAQGIKSEIYKKIIKEDLSLLLPNIKQKTLVLWGKKDTYVSLKIGKKIASLIPNSQLKVYNKAGHGLHKQALSEFISDINNFISVC